MKSKFPRYFTFKLFFISVIMVNCIGFGEPKVVVAYRIFNDTNDSIEIIEFGKGLTDSSIFEYSRPFKTLRNGAKLENHREFIKSNGFLDVQLLENWKRVICENNFKVIILNKDSINEINEFKKGLVNSCVLKLLPLILNSLEKNNFEIHYKQ